MLLQVVQRELAEERARRERMEAQLQVVLVVVVVVVVVMVMVMVVVVMMLMRTLTAASIISNASQSSHTPAATAARPPPPRLTAPCRRAQCNACSCLLRVLYIIVVTLAQVQLKELSKTGNPLCMPAAAAAVPVMGGAVLPSIDITRVLARKTIEAAIAGQQPCTPFPSPKYNPSHRLPPPQRHTPPPQEPLPPPPPRRPHLCRQELASAAGQRVAAAAREEVVAGPATAHAHGRRNRRQVRHPCRAGRNAVQLEAERHGEGGGGGEGVARCQ
jgi:hypothetical protein